MSKKIQTLVLLSLAPLAPLACDSAEPFGGVTPDGLGAPAGKADGSEVSLAQSGVFDILQLRGDAAAELYDVFDRSGGFSELSRDGLDYRYGVYSICVSNGDAAACNLYSRRATLGEGDFLATIHGERFDSASSEVFGAIARSQGESPANLDVAQSGPVLCVKTTVDVWCGIAEHNTDAKLELSFVTLPALGDDYLYEGWMITADGPVTSGRFTVSGDEGSHTFVIDRALADASTLFVLTIEPKFGDNPAPSDTHIAAGPFVNGVAQLTTVHGAALGTDFLDSNGGFILETPTTAGNAEDYDQGVWFLEPAAGPGAGLRLPELPAGWAYEGWVVGEEGPISTGTFVDPASADRDGAGPTAGPDGAPPFPGQDFIDPAMSLIGQTVVISVEPDPDDSPMPFFIKPLAGGVVDDGPGAFQMLGNIAADSQITGLATLES